VENKPSRNKNVIAILLIFVDGDGSLLVTRGPKYVGGFKNGLKHGRVRIFGDSD
jgi:hypothetical protein